MTKQIYPFFVIIKIQKPHINISKQLDKKIKAMEVYTSEIQKFPHPRSSEYLKINANRWGGISGNIAAEAFEIIRKIDK